MHTPFSVALLVVGGGLAAADADAPCSKDTCRQHACCDEVGFQIENFNTVLWFSCSLFPAELVFPSATCIIQTSDESIFTYRNLHRQTGPSERVRVITEDGLLLLLLFLFGRAT